MRFHVDPDTVPPGILRHPRRDYLLAKWLGRPRTDEESAKVAAVYKEARRRRDRGERVVVDHIEPLCSDWVCGLHHSANLRIVSESENRRKSNGADHPELTLVIDPHQMRLEI